jgi:flagellar hook-basal body complex protein FliE
MDNAPQQTLTANNQPAQPVQQPPQAGGSPAKPSNSSKPPKASRQNLYIGIGIILIIMILGAVQMNHTMQSASPNTQGSMNNTTPTLQLKSSSALPPGNSGTQLNQDLQSIDRSLNSADTSTRNVDQGLNDQETNLTE